ncbi:MAG TPA: hypothetical protein VD907_06690 [Verrucomicrobiae bacterium]|nr:hypothetical protein [Verrucomicrobiae bacterium]
MTTSEHKKLIFDTCLEYGVEDTLQIAYVLATAGLESGYGRSMVEKYNGEPEAYFEGRYGAGTRVGKQLGNTLPGDGAKFRGRGYVQITGRYNYDRFAKITGVDLIRFPEKAATPEIAVKILVLGMRDGLFTGKKLSDYLVTMGACNLEQARKIVNPGEGTRRIEEFEKEFDNSVAYINSMP